MLRFHDLRHTHATMLIQQKINPKVIQERLGHSRIGITLDIYSHVLPSMQQEVAMKLDEMLGSLTIM
ncbi:tyrosine-type recombinase/integrase [Neobacillus pocheonensis]|uniref:tyrosine-type recombinase/integrase n=1 Tax=Neobacillus pocheonensis TaxID=363869 RepID=UPI003D2B886F